MSELIRVPRIFLPRENIEGWAVCPSRCRTDKGYLRRMEREKSSFSALRFLLPEKGDPAGAREAMYDALERDRIEKLNRGGVLVERTGKRGTRFGIVLSVDLEEVSFERGTVTAIRPIEEIGGEHVRELVALRKACPLEFPAIRLLYRDKKCKIMSALPTSALEELYAVPIEDGELRGYFIPDDVSYEIADDLYAKRDPMFAAAEGIDELYAAKLCYEEIKRAGGGETHPARHVLVEFVNIFEENVPFETLGRAVYGADADELAACIAREVRGKRAGNVLWLSGKGALPFAAAERAIDAYLKEHGGSVRAVSASEDVSDADLVVRFKPVSPDDLFSALQEGQIFPRGTFRTCEPNGEKYSFEGKEISYD